MSDVGERELLAIIFTDAVDSTARTASDEDHSLRILLGDLDHIRNEAAVRGGIVLKNTGDGLLISFKSAVDAVECALSIQKGFANRPANTSFRHKVGVHIGDVVKKDGDIYGSGVNTASRLVAQCPPGGVCLSSTVYELVKQKSQLGSLQVENFQLTNIEPPIGAYRIRPHLDDTPVPGPKLFGRRWRGQATWGLGVLVLWAAGWISIELWKAQSGKNSHTSGSNVSASGDRATAEVWLPGVDPQVAASVYFKIWNSEMGEDYVLNCYNADEGRGKCLLFMNEGFKNQSGQLWDLRHPGSLRNSFLGQEREISIDQMEGTAFMGVTGASQEKIKMIRNSDSASFKILVGDRYLTVEPGRPGKNPRVWASRSDRGRKSDWIVRPTSIPLPVTTGPALARKQNGAALIPETMQSAQSVPDSSGEAEPVLLEGEFQGHTYRFVPEKQSWHQARKTAADLGGYLVSITTQEENDFVVGLIQKASSSRKDKNPMVWIGLNNDYQPKDWKWESGEPFEYSSWWVGEPNNWGNSESAVFINKQSTISPESIGKWNDMSSDFKTYFIIEKATPPSS